MGLVTRSDRVGQGLAAWMLVLALVNLWVLRQADTLFGQVLGLVAFVACSVGVPMQLKWGRIRKERKHGAQGAGTHA